MNLRWHIRHWLLLAEIEWLAWKNTWAVFMREMWRR